MIRVEQALIRPVYDDVLDVFSDRYERARLDVVESTVGNEVLYVFVGEREALDLVENDDALALLESFSVGELEHAQERVDVLALVSK